MIANPVLRKLVEFEYAAVRTPLALLDRRLPETSSVHRVLDRGLSGLDGFVSGLLTAPADYPPAQPRPDRGAGPERVPEQEPAPQREPRLEDLEHEREQIAEAIRAQQPDVGELADPELDVADVQAELRAKHLIEERLEQERNRR